MIGARSIHGARRCMKVSTISGSTNVKKPPSMRRDRLTSAAASGARAAEKDASAGGTRSPCASRQRSSVATSSNAELTPCAADQKAR
eukprot:365093-Chlamydomonas_euryale.AAC.3